MAQPSATPSKPLQYCFPFQPLPILFSTTSNIAFPIVFNHLQYCFLNGRNLAFGRQNTCRPASPPAFYHTYCANILPLLPCHFLHFVCLLIVYYSLLTLNVLLYTTQTLFIIGIINDHANSIIDYIVLHSIFILGKSLYERR